MAEPGGGVRLYGDLASWWPLISPVEVYEEDAEIAAELFASATRSVREVLELGSGGGHLARHWGSRYALTLVDLSPQMLAVSRALNPGAEHLVGDMRTLRLGWAFDAVLVHDAIGYMTTEEDLAAVFRTAFAHCRPGGTAVFFPDHVAESYGPVTACGGSDGQDGRGVRYLEWGLPAVPGECSVRTDYTFTLRGAAGEVEVVHETHVTGLFPVAVWERLLAQAGFAVSAVREDGGRERTLFLAHRPA
ncbi:class I SAM-dependent methyltransferase [Streptomyces sp. DSM 44917]|uniref:Class I SAM-dependent methyltransferase n=1 Tax=Streptomyces boetiae TaxID=3075541 RepID=A0ABU2LFA4_9ACTN|nr:class I SAM-dependent methyltransferase [Streptomyces sp. DSM 44917]MDT0310270.1 class I SAM-dependent methyltransferase [Streptomyces sp. DSM 44917]